LEQANVDYSPSGEPSFQDDAVLEQVTPQSYYTFPRLSSILGNRLSQSISIPQYSNFASSYQDPEESFTSSDDEDSDIDPESAVSRHSIPNMSSFRRSSTKEAEFNPVEITPLTTVPNSSHAQYLGRISLHFIKESNLMYDSLLGSSGMGEFTHVFLMELLAIVKAHVICLGGNAVVSFSIDQIHFTESLKNQGYAMVSVSGDVVQVAYLESRNLDQLSTNIFSPQ
jgi:hypothetical protein